MRRVPKYLALYPYGLAAWCCVLAWLVFMPSFPLLPSINAGLGLASIIVIFAPVSLIHFFHQQFTFSTGAVLLWDTLYYACFFLPVPFILRAREKSLWKQQDIFIFLQIMLLCVHTLLGIYSYHILGGHDFLLQRAHASP